MCYTQRMKGVATMLTNFGKALRKIRIDRDELLRDMAVALGVSSAYLSAVETGKRRIPDDWVDKISLHYHLSPNEHAELLEAAEESAQEVRISLQDVSDAKRGAVLTFARTLDHLSDEELKKIMQTMRSKRGDARHE